MLGSPFHSTKQSCKGTTDAFIKFHSTAMYSQQKMEGFARERTLPETGTVKTCPCCRAISLKLPCPKALGLVSAPYPQHKAKSQPGPAEVSLEDLGNAKQQESCVTVLRMSRICAHVKEPPATCLDHCTSQPPT